MGSAALGLMVRRDLNLTVVCPKLSLEPVTAVGARLAAHPRVKTVTFRNDTAHWNTGPIYPEGLYPVYYPLWTDHVDDATVENGCLCVVPGSHKLGPIEHCHDGSAYLPLDEWPLERAVPVEANAGDVLFFGYCMVHGSYVNRSERSRRILLIQMRSPTDRPLNEAHRSPGQGTMLRGINPDAAQI